MVRNRDTTEARKALAGAAAKARAIDLLDARELRVLLAYLLRDATYEQLEQLLESRRWRGDL
jgi:hypothetical protein